MFAAQEKLKKFNKFWGSQQFEWRISSMEIGSIYDIFITRKFEPWRDILKLDMLKIIEGNLLGLAKSINTIPENKNPHR